MQIFPHTRDDTYELEGTTIRLLVSDNDPDRPFVLQNTDIAPRPDGTFHFNRVEGAGSAQLKHWQYIIGGHVAKKFLRLDRLTKWRATLPAGYVLWSECKSHSVEDPKDVRTDQYLTCGPIKFRSPNEFLPHYLWLLERGPERPGLKCLCKYCGSRHLKQSEINKLLDLPDPVRGKGKKPEKRLKVVQLRGNGLYTIVSPV
ncbi:hypothetical protein AURDEDRAFT_181148 [Auricularia subglabra TFB-10046 SS5]|nr:hypothetical protein AURDEDRAFT_181148 [Auricularia subglabra TFB-10046 SS5]